MKQKKLEEAKRLYQTANQDQKYVLESLFPELKNEDERIRGAIIDHLKDSNLIEWAAWLEKQSKKKSIDDLTPQEAMDIAVAKCFEQGEQKSTDKVEPKFHEGDWAVSNLDGKARQISEVHFDEYNSYYVVDGKSVNLEEYDRLHHLWTIKDAKDGDVLVAKGKYYKEYIFIYSKMTDDNVMSTHCGYDVTHNESDKTLSRFGRVEDFYSVCPATKEQRDLLFSKMKESGYEWDANKKELKKIEQKPLQWNILDYKTWQYIVSDVLTKHNGIGQYLDDGFCKKIAKYMQEEWSKKLSTEQKYAWSEEDDYNLQCMIAKVTSDIQKGNVGRNQELIDWLKSLKPQNR